MEVTELLVGQMMLVPAVTLRKGPAVPRHRARNDGQRPWRGTHCAEGSVWIVRYAVAHAIHLGHADETHAIVCRSPHSVGGVLGKDGDVGRSFWGMNGRSRGGGATSVLCNATERMRVGECRWGGWSTVKTA